MKKITVSILTLVFMLTLAGCGNKSDKKDRDKKNQEPMAQTEEKAPVATGRVDDTVNAIIDEANKENDLVSGADNVAKDAINDAQEADDLKNAYDENEF